MPFFVMIPIPEETLRKQHFSVPDATEYYITPYPKNQWFYRISF